MRARGRGQVADDGRAYAALRRRWLNLVILLRAIPKSSMLTEIPGHPGNVSSVSLRGVMRNWLAGLVLIFAAGALLQGCASSYILDEDELNSRIADACRSFYNEKRTNLHDAWSFVSRIEDSDEDSSGCYLAIREDIVAADIAAMKGCEAAAQDLGQEYSCHFFRSSDGYAYSDPYTGPPITVVVTQDPSYVEDAEPSESGGDPFWDVFGKFVDDAAGVARAAGAIAGSGATSAPSSNNEPSYSGVPVIPLPTGTAGGTVSIGGSGASCGRRWVGAMPQSACRLGGNIPDSSITSDEDPDPVAGCYTPPC